MKKYYVLIFILIIVAKIFSSSLGTKLDSMSPTIQGLAMLAFIIPLCLLLYFIGKDKKSKMDLE